VPKNVFKQSDVKKVVKGMFGNKIAAIDRMLDVFDNSEIGERFFCVPMEWFFEEHGFAEKNELYIKHATQLSALAIQKCLAKSDFTVQDVDKIIFISSTGIATPSLDTNIINEMNFSKHVKRTPIWGLGCAGGAVGLSRAYEYTTAFPEEKVLLVAVELCGLTFLSGDFSKSNLIATALFGDGAAAVLVVGDKVPSRGNNTSIKIIDTRSTIWEKTQQVMGWKVTGQGLQVIFSKDIPNFVRTHLQENITEFVQEHGLSLSDIKNFVIHPGGTKVIKAYQEAFSLVDDQVVIEKEIIARYGNMSSPTVLFVLERFMESKQRQGEYGLISALGPGFSSESLLVKW
jgi:alkylresorcinol/alkylpyrone synthase